MKRTASLHDAVGADKSSQVVRTVTFYCIFRFFFAEHFKDDRSPVLYTYNHTHTAVNAVNEQFDGDCQ